jgi:hypothetical protein
MEKETEYTRMSACGHDCTACDIFLLPVSLKVQNKILPWFRSQKWLGENEGIKEVVERKMYCKGCGDKDTWWSGDCGVAICRKQKKELVCCAECGGCPCGIYKKWSGQGGRYKEAFDYMTERIQ